MVIFNCFLKVLFPLHSDRISQLWSEIIGKVRDRDYAEIWILCKKNYSDSTIRLSDYVDYAYTYFILHYPTEFGGVAFQLWTLFEEKTTEREK